MTYRYKINCLNCFLFHQYILRLLLHYSVLSVLPLINKYIFFCQFVTIKIERNDRNKRKYGENKKFQINIKKIINLYYLSVNKLDIFFFSSFSRVDGEYLFADPESKLSKYGPKSWRSSHTHVSHTLVYQFKAKTSVDLLFYFLLFTN